MGGHGSGTWDRFDKKITVEESLVLSVGDFHRRRRSWCGGTFTWTWAGGRTASVGYSVSFYGEPTITLQYRWRDREDMRVSIRLQGTPTPFEGQRLWFACPLIVGGVFCDRRVGKVYLPPGARYFGCRKCHDLTYQSCQEAHQMERLLAAATAWNSGRIV